MAEASENRASESKRLSVTETHDDTTATVTVKGWITTGNVQQAEDVVMSLPETVTRVVFAMDDTEYISSSGIRLFIMTGKMLSERGGEIVISHPNEFVIETLTMTGLTDVLRVEM